jgi:DNA-binding Lrp family transcriptional regulator
VIGSADLREARLLNDFQRGFPLVHAPYAEIADRLDVDEAWVHERLARFVADGRVSRVGAVFRPHAIGASTLAALAVPDDDVERVAAAVSALPEVNHNYEREHRLNLWFVVTACDAAGVAAALDMVRRRTGYVPISLPLISDYWIDLGFDLEPASGEATRTVPPRRAGAPIGLDDDDRRLIAALERGLPVVAAPYEDLARRAGLAEADALSRIARWIDAGIVRRLGIVLRHHELGYTANAMCVLDVPDVDVDRHGRALARETGVTLCYRRARALPDWPYNLYAMVHGRDRGQVELRIADMAAWQGLDRYPAAVLFSRRRFKQRGARYMPDPARGETAS